ncbi:hypothetical protein HD554DRAFT_2144747 [Boletus coccyginus]|nr:hypothetical protein HD554DRAFT_2144747 [Boletus coccyginus]
MLSDDECCVRWVGRALGARRAGCGVCWVARGRWAHVACILMSWRWRLGILVLLCCVVGRWDGERHRAWFGLGKFLVRSYLRRVARISCAFGTLDVFSVYGLYTCWMPWEMYGSYVDTIMGEIFHDNYKSDIVYVPHQYAWFLVPMVCIRHLNSTGSLALLRKTQIYSRVTKGVCRYYRFNAPKLLFGK